MTTSRTLLLVALVAGGWLLWSRSPATRAIASPQASVAPMAQADPAAETPTLTPASAMTPTDCPPPLTPEAQRVLREEATEPPWSSPLNKEKRPGTYACAGCAQPLFSSEAKFDSGTGWPSFDRPAAEGTLGFKVDHQLWSPRTEVHCARCGGHLGHVFDDGPTETGRRFCINGLSLQFRAQAEASADADLQPRKEI